MDAHKYCIRTVDGGDRGYFDGSYFGKSIKEAKYFNTLTDLVQHCFRTTRDFRYDVEIVEVSFQPTAKVI